MSTRNKKQPYSSSGEETLLPKSERVTWPIALRLLIVFGFMLLLMVVIGVVGYLRINALHQAQTAVSNAIFVSQTFHEVEASLLNGYKEETSYVDMHDITSEHVAQGLTCTPCHSGENLTANLGQEAEVLQALADEGITRNEALAKLDTLELVGDEQANLLQLKTLLEQTTAAMDEVVKLVEAGSIREAKRYHQDVVVPLVGDITTLYDEQIKTSIAENTTQNGERVDRLASSGIILIIAISVGSMVIGCISAILAARSITRPIKNLTNVAQAITRGNLEVEAKVTSRDETGVLAKTFNLMVTRLLSMLREAEQREYLQSTIAHYGSYMSQVMQGDLSARLTLGCPAGKNLPSPHASPRAGATS